MKTILHLLLTVSAVCLASCGTVAPVNSKTGGSAAAVAGGRSFNRVLVKDFRNAADPGNPAANAAGQILANKIQSEILRLKPAANVARSGDADAGTVVIGGEITRFTEGNAALRLFVGMGAGSSYFDANIRVSDSTGKVITTLVADKNSWGLGGSLAAGQTVETFMTEAARKTAAEVAPLLK
ncbi:MAG TPA: hypothetical protein DIT64_16125 [Verrucomicrobiales bacterium]|nr:hypothetical protein [Verrucomicrobiales bacterium]